MKSNVNIVEKIFCMFTCCLEGKSDNVNNVDSYPITKIVIKRDFITIRHFANNEFYIIQYVLAYKKITIIMFIRPLRKVHLTLILQYTSKIGIPTTKKPYNQPTLNHSPN